MSGGQHPPSVWNYMNDFLEKKANCLFKTIYTNAPFEYECKNNPDNNGYLRTEWGVVLHFCNAPKKMVGKTVVISEYKNYPSEVTDVLSWCFKETLSPKKMKTPTNVPSNIKTLFRIINSNNVVKEDISRWFYDYKTFGKGTKEGLTTTDNFGEFLKFITKETIFFARHEGMPFEINRRERRWFVELLTIFLIDNYVEGKKQLAQ